jgi:hypothetical protein
MSGNYSHDLDQIQRQLLWGLKQLDVWQGSEDPPSTPRSGMSGKSYHRRNREEHQ